MKERKGERLLPGFGEAPQEKAEKTGHHQTRGAAQCCRDAERRREDEKRMRQVDPRADLIERIRNEEDALIERCGRAVEARQKDEEQRGERRSRGDRKSVV